MTTELNTKLRLTADNSDLLQKTAQVRAANAEIGASAEKAGAQASAGMAKAAASTKALADGAVNARNVVATLGPATSSAAGQVVTSTAQAAAGVESLGSAAAATSARVVAANDAMAASYAAFVAESRVIQDFMATEAKSLDDVVERRLAYQEALQAGILTQQEFASASAALAKQESAIIAAEEKHAAGVASLIQKYTSGSAAAQKLAADEVLLNDALKSGAGDAEAITAALASIAAKQKALSETEVGLQLNTANVRREFSLLAKDVATGDFSRAGRELGTLAGSTNAVRLAFTGWGAAIGGIVAFLALLIAGLVSGISEQTQFERSLISTGNAAGVTVGQLNEMRDEIAGSSAEYGKASQALNALASSGKISGSALQNAAQAAVSLSDVTGESVEKAVAEIEKLGEKPTAAIVKLNEQYHFLTQAQYDHIAALEREGDAQAAADAAFKAAADSFKDRSEQLASQAGTLVRFYDNLASSARAAWQAIKDIGRTDLDAQYEQALKDYTRARDSVGVGARSAEDVAAQEAYRDKLEKVVLELHAKIDAERKAAAATGEHARSTAEGISAQQQLADKYSDLTRKYSEQAATIDRTAVAEVEYQRKTDLAAASLGKYGSDVEAVRKKINEEADAAHRAAAEADATAAARKNAAESARLWAEDERTLVEVLSQAKGEIAAGEKVLSDLSTGVSGPFTAAIDKYDEQILTLARDFDGWTTLLNTGQVSQEKYNDEVDRLIDGTDKATQALEREKQVLIARNDVVGNYLHQLSEDRALAGLSDRERAITQALQDQIDKWNRLTPQMQAAEEAAGHLNPTTEAGAAAIRDATAATYDYTTALQQNEEINRSWIQIVSNGFDSFGNSIAQFVNGGIRTWHDFWKSLLGDASQFIGAIIQQMLRLTVFNGIVNNLFGLTGASALPTGLGNGWLGQIFGGTGAGGGATGAGGSSLTSTLFSPSSWLSAGQNLRSGFQSFAGNTWSKLTGAYTYTPSGIYGPSAELSNDFVGPPSALAGPQYGQYGGYNSALGQGLGIAGGIFAGYSAYQNAGGGLSGAAAGAAYGIGTYYAGAAISTAFAGGISAGLAAVPVVGWIAIAAMLIDKFSGGKLFGTGYRTTGATQAINVGLDGATASTTLQQYKEKALFGGKSYRDKNVASSQDLQDAAAQIEASYRDMIKSVAEQIGIETPGLVAESLKTVSKYDKHGKVTSTAYEVDVNGKVYQEATAELQQTRAAAEQLIGTLAHSEVGKDAEQIAEQWRSSAQTLMDGAQLMVLATTDIVKANGLLGDGGNLADTVALVQKLQGANESLSQTYVRLQTESATLRAIYDNLGVTTSRTGAEFVEFADDMVKAAGGLDQLNALWNTYWNGYFSDSERAAAKLRVDQANAAKLGAAIGQDPNESMAQFRENFTAVLDSLSAEDVVKWLQFAAALEAVNEDLGTTASQAEQAAAAQAQAQAQYEAFIGQFKAILNPLSEFESSLNGLQISLAANIDQANAYAVAAGQSGASTEDLTTILQASVVAGAQAYAKIDAEVTQRAEKLFGSDIDQLQKRLDAAYGGGAQNVQLIVNLQKQIADAQAKADAASKLSDARALLSDLGQLGAFSGQSLDELAKAYNIPLDQFAQLLGTNADGLQQQFDQAEALAASNLQIANNTEYTNEYLADILAAVKGEALPFSVADLIAAASGAKPATTVDAADGKGAKVRTATGKPITDTVPASTQPTTVVSDPGKTGGGSDDGVGKEVGRVAVAIDDNTKAFAARLDEFDGQLQSMNVVLRQLFSIADRQSKAVRT